MTTRTRQAIKCDCGHRGELVHAENDAPYSAMWEQYTVTGFNCEGATFTGFAELKAAGNILAYLKPSCPVCGQIGQVSFA